MNSGKTIFAQLMDFVTTYEFRKCVDRYNGNRNVISFSCWDQFLCMAFALSHLPRKLERYSGLPTGHSVQAVSLGHSGKGIPQYARLCKSEPGLVDLHRFRQDSHSKSPKALHRRFLRHRTGSGSVLLGFDHYRSLPGAFSWAEFRKRKGAVKLHTLLGLRGNIPSVVIITKGTVHDVNILDDLIM